MAQKFNVAAQCADIVRDVRAGVFKPVYLLMGEEPYYPELVCNAVLENCIDEAEKDFNETVCYGSDVTAEQVITAARRFPMMAERQLVVVKEAQLMKDIESLALYCAEPLDSTVLVVLMHKASADKRKSFYKSVQKTGVIVDSPALRDYEISRWIQEYYSSRGLDIDPRAAVLLGESAGTELQTIVAETEKLLRSLPEGCVKVTVEDIEKNVGVSKQYSVFELSQALSMRNSAKALKIASHLGSSAKFQMPAAIGPIYTRFYQILRYGALLSRGGSFSQEDKAAALVGVNPYFYRDYDAAVRNFPPQKAMAVISILREYDYLGKGGDGGVTATEALFVEMVAKILNV